MTRHGRLIIAGALGLVNACASVNRAGPAVQEQAWPAYLGSSARAGTMPDTPTRDPQPVWRTDVGRGAIGAPALAEDVLAISLTDRQVALLDRTTGAVLWRTRLGQHLGSGPVLADDRVWVATQDDGGRVYSLRLADGRRVWSQRAGNVAAPLLLDAGRVYSASLEGHVIAFDRGGGQVLWRARVGGGVRAAPVATGAVLIVATTTDSVFALDAASGTVRARRAIRGAVLAAPAMADSLVLIGTTAGILEALDPVTLETRWRMETGAAILGNVAVRGDAAYAVTTAGSLWTVPLAGPGGARHVPTGLISRGGPLPVGGGVLLAGVRGDVVLLDPVTGERRWSARVGSAVSEPPLVDDRTILVLTERAEVIAFR